MVAELVTHLADFYNRSKKVDALELKSPPPSPAGGITHKKDGVARRTRLCIIPGFLARH